MQPLPIASPHSKTVTVANYNHYVDLMRFGVQLRVLLLTCANEDKSDIKSSVASLFGSPETSGRFLHSIGVILGQSWYQASVMAIGQQSSDDAIHCPSVGFDCGLFASFPLPTDNVASVTPILRNFLFALNLYSMLTSRLNVTLPLLLVYVPSSHSSLGHLMVEKDTLDETVTCFTREFLFQVCQLPNNTVNHLMSRCCVKFTNDPEASGANVAVCYGGPLTSGNAGLHGQMEWKFNNNGFAAHHKYLRTIYFLRATGQFPDASTHGSFVFAACLALFKFVISSTLHFHTQDIPKGVLATFKKTVVITGSDTPSLLRPPCHAHIVCNRKTGTRDLRLPTKGMLNFCSSRALVSDQYIFFFCSAADATCLDMFSWCGYTRARLHTHVLDTAAMGSFSARDRASQPQQLDSLVRKIVHIVDGPLGFVCLSCLTCLVY